MVRGTGARLLGSRLNTGLMDETGARRDHLTAKI